MCQWDNYVVSKTMIPPDKTDKTIAKTKVYPKYPFLITRTCFRIMKDYYKVKYKPIDNKARPKNRSNISSEQLIPFLEQFVQ